MLTAKTFKYKIHGDFCSLSIFCVTNTLYFKIFLRSDLVWYGESHDGGVFNPKVIGKWLWESQKQKYIETMTYQLKIFATCRLYIDE